MHLASGVVHNFPRLCVYRISVPYAQKDPRILFKKRKGLPQEFWSLVSTIHGSIPPPKKYVGHDIQNVRPFMFADTMGADGQ